MRLFLCIMENTVKNNIHANQIFPLLEHINMKILFISPLIILNRKEFKFNWKKFKKPRVHQVRVPLLSYNFFMNPLIFPILLIFSILILTYYKLRFGVTQIHARNHLSAACAVIFMKIFPSVTVISDLRGLYAEEGVIIRRWKFMSWQYCFWKAMERFICNNSTRVSAISKNMVSYLREYTRAENISFVTAVVDTDKFFYSDGLRQRFRMQECISDDEIVFIYVGSLGLWHDTKTFYAQIERYIRENRIEKYRVYILSSLNTNQERELHARHSAHILSVEPGDVNKFLCGADIAVLPGTEKLGVHYSLLYKTMISSKLEEYLVTGLKVIINPRIEEGVSLMQEAANSDYKHYNIERAKVADFYRSKFSVNEIAQRYEDLFDRVQND